MHFRRWRGGTGRRAGLKIQERPILSGQLSLNAIHDFHREIRRLPVNSGDPRVTVLRTPKVEQK
jgi:hypothetical protein